MLGKLIQLTRQIQGRLKTSNDLFILGNGVHPMGHHSLVIQLSIFVNDSQYWD